MHGCLSPLCKMEQCLPIISGLLIMPAIIQMLSFGNNIKILYIFSKDALLARFTDVEPKGDRAEETCRSCGWDWSSSMDRFRGSACLISVPVPLSDRHQSKSAKSRCPCLTPCKQRRVLTFSVRREHCPSSWLFRIRSTNLTSRKAQILK